MSVSYYYQTVSLKVPPPFRDFGQNRRGGILSKIFLLRISLIKKFSGASRRIRRGGTLKGGTFSETVW